MPGPTPISAPYRVTFNYTVDGLSHNMRQYCDAQPDILDSTGWALVGHSLLGNPGLSVAAQAVWALLQPMYEAVVASFNGAVLEQRVGVAYVPIASYFTGSTPTNTGYNKAAQNTFFFYGPSRNIHKLVLFENAFGAPVKVTSLGGLPADLLAIVNSCSSPSGAFDIGNWAMDRAGQTGMTWVSYVSSLNRKVRRRRGLV